MIGETFAERGPTSPRTASHSMGWTYVARGMTYVGGSVTKSSREGNTRKTAKIVEKAVIVTSATALLL